MFYWFIHIISGILIRILLCPAVIGRENMPKNGSFIIASNHRSDLDPPIIAAKISRKVHFIAKRELFANKTAEAFFKMLNCIRLNRHGVDRSAIEEAVEALNRGSGLLIFPEGTRSRDKKLKTGKPGVAVFAITAQVPVIPVFLSGTERLTLRGILFMRFAKVSIVFGEKIFPPKDTDINEDEKKIVYQEFTDKIMREIAKLEPKA